MKVEFYKYQGAGNDFIMIDNRSGVFDRSRTDWVKQLCDRRFGIGADGLILLQKKEGYDFEMVYYNADGNESSMCGNGGRCIVSFASELGLVNGQAGFMAVDGPHTASIDGYYVSLRMSDVDQVERGDGFYYLNTGSPHYVQVVESLRLGDFVEMARAIRYNDRFREAGTNVNFIHFEDPVLRVRTYERGVEDETLACGTGVVASVLAYHLEIGGGVGEHTTRVQAVGGALKVTFNYHGKGRFTDIILTGPAVKVFKGSVELV